MIVPMPDTVSYTVNKARRTDYCVFIFYFLALIFSVATLILSIIHSCIFLPLRKLTES